jgi:hypothetical protein
MSNYQLNPRYRGGTRLVETPGRADSYEAVIRDGDTGEVISLGHRATSLEAGALYDAASKIYPVPSSATPSAYSGRP